MKTFLVNKKDQGKRLDSFLREQLNGFSGKKIQNAMHNFGCLVNGKSERFASYKLQGGDKVSFDTRHLNTQELKIKILFEDDYLIIIDKPAHLTCEKKFFAKFFKDEIFLPHRLDKQTSGLMMLAKSEKVLEALEDLFRKREVEKAYLAIVTGQVVEKEQIIKLPIKKASKFDGGGKWQVNSKGAYAETKLKRITANAQASFLRCFPKTGRTHQIRVHLSEKNHPIVGDTFYGAKKTKVFIPRVCLHSEKLSFVHPISKEIIRFESAMPQDFETVLKELRLKV